MYDYFYSDGVLSPCSHDALIQARKCALKSRNPPFLRITIYTEQGIITTIATAAISSAPDSNPTHIAELHAISAALEEELGL